MQRGLYTIGEVARLSGLKVQTIRYYSDIGVLPPSSLTEAGYRLYSQADLARLELVRTLRGVGFDLQTIARLLSGELGPAEALKLQLEALEVQARSLQRQQTVLRAVLRSDATTLLARLHRMQTLARLDRLERETFLARHLEQGLGGQRGDPEVWRAAVLELAEIASDPGFLQVLEKQAKLAAHFSAQGSDWARWQKLGEPWLQAALEAMQQGHAPQSPPAREIVRGWVGAMARALGREQEEGFARWLLEQLDSATDPRMHRYWELIAVLKNWQYRPPPQARAMNWLIEGLRSSLAADGEGVAGDG
jgi:DNA-binding transcriptional MerR regulator